MQTSPVQNWIIGIVTSRLSKGLQTKVEIKHVDFSLFNKMHLNGVLVEDRYKDTVLSAGEVTVNVTDWFFLKQDVELKYIGLKDAFIHLQRSDSVWRHQFLLDYFTTPGSKKKKKNAITLNFKEVDLQNVLVKKTDKWLGSDMVMSLASLNTDPRNINFQKRIIDIHSLVINKPYISIRSYKGNKPSITTPASKPKTNKDSLQWNAGKWYVHASNISLRNGTFIHDKDGTPETHSGFDGNHFQFSKIYGDLQEVQWKYDTITTAINLSTVEKSGFNVQHLIANAKVTPREITFQNLDIRTDESYIRNYFSMQFDGLHAFSDFINSVKMEGNFVNSQISSDDIAYFAPAVKSWKRKIIVSGKITGTVAALNGRNLNIQAGSQTKFTGNAVLNGLPNIQTTFMDIEASDFNTTYADAVAFIPSFKKIQKPDLRQLQYIRFKGNFTGFIRDFVTYGTIQTALGTLITDVNMKMPIGRKPVYSGNVTTSSFNLGKLLNNPKLGYISTTTKLKGAGFNTADGDIALESKIRYLDYNKYRYQNIQLDGTINKNLFDGHIHINDPNANLSLNGLIDYNKSKPEFNFLADIQTIHFKTLGFTRDDLSISGKINAQFSGKNVDDFLGTANITDATFIKGDQPLSFTALNVTADSIDGQKHIHISSHEMVADVQGMFTIQELPNSIKTFLNKYYPSYIKPPATIPKNQAFHFDIKTNYISDYIQLIDSSLSGFDNSHISGDLNTVNNSLQLTGAVPYFSYKNYGFNDVALQGIGTYDSLMLEARTNTITVNDSATIPSAVVKITAHNDVSRVTISSAGNTIHNAQVNALVTTYNNGLKIEFEPSSFIINGKTWTIDKNGVLEFRKNTPVHGLLVLKETNQEITIRTLPSDIGSWNDISIGIKNLNLGDITPYVLPANRLEGIANGDIFLENPGSNMKITSQNFTGTGIRLDNDSIGNIAAKFVYDMATRELIVNGNTLNPQKKDLAFNIHLYLKDKQSQANNSIALNANSFDIKYLNRFLGLLFSDIEGEVTGNFELKGPFNALSIVGKGRLHNAGLRVNYTQCFYKIEDKDIELQENEINLDNIVLRDTVTNNPVYVQGSIIHNSFKNMFFDITVSTRKPGTHDDANNRPVQVLNTTYRDNNIFYGNVKATGSFALIGPQENTYMKIDGIASTEHESTFILASGESKAGKMPDWLVEKKYGTAITDSLLTPKQSNITYDIDITANPNVLMRVIIDDQTGDEIKGRGHGTLNLRSGTSEPLTMRGRFDIDEGSYNFTFQSFFKKPFILQKGEENFITWNGDPLNASVNFHAQYKAERVSFAPLAGYAIDQSYANTRENVYVNAQLTGRLFKPDFNFSLELDPNSKFRNDFNVSSALEQIEKTQNEITRQVTYLIVFNSFAPPETGVANTGLGNTVNEFTYNTISSISGLFFNQINKTLNNELAKLLGANVSVVFSGSVYNRNVLTSANNGFNLNQANLNGALLIPLFNDRFVISLGSSMEVPLQSTLQQSVQFLPDVTAEWLLNKSGTIRLNFFYRENLDFLTTSSSGAAKLRRTGGGLSYKKEFDTLGDIFKNVKRRTQRLLESQPATPLPDTNTKKVEPVINKQDAAPPLQTNPNQQTPK